MNQVKRFAVATFFAIVLTFGGLVTITSTTLAAESFVTPKGVTLLSADEIREALVGYTVIGTLDGTTYYEYMPDDSNLFGVWKFGHYRGAWSVSTKNGIAAACFDYEGTDSDGCWTIAQNNDTLIYYKSDGTEDFREVREKGNPKNL